MQLHFTERLMEVPAESRLGPTNSWMVSVNVLSYRSWGTALELSIFNILGQKSWFQFLAVLLNYRELRVSQSRSFPARFAVFTMRTQMLPSDLPHRNALRAHETPCKRPWEHTEWHQLFLPINLMRCNSWLYNVVLLCRFSCSVTTYKRLLCFVVFHFS